MPKLVFQSDSASCQLCGPSKLRKLCRLVSSPLNQKWKFLIVAVIHRTCSNCAWDVVSKYADGLAAAISIIDHIKRPEFTVNDETQTRPQVF